MLRPKRKRAQTVKFVFVCSIRVKCTYFAQFMDYTKMHTTHELDTIKTA